MSTLPLINLAVVGADRRGRLSLLAHQPENGFRLTAACSLTPERLSIYRETCGDGILLTSDYQKILDDPSISAVFVCTPDHLHEEHAVRAMQAGKDVFLEKPMAVSIDGCDTILRVSRETGRRLFVGHNMRFFPVMQKMHELVQSGAIGEVQAIWCRHFISYGGDAYFKDWHSERQYANSLLLQKGAHDIDILHWLGGAHTRRVVAMGKLSVYDKLPRRKAGEPVPSVEFNTANWPPEATSGYNPVIDVEDHYMVLMDLENGVQCTYLECHYTPDDCRNYTIIGTRGRIENYGDHSAPGHWATVHLWDRRTGYSEMGHQVFRIPHMDGSHGGSDPLLVEDFLRMLRGQPTVGATPIDARMAVATGCLATQSLRNGNNPENIPTLQIKNR
ncbi:MAG: Gfo/Idh/MocA family oxidoreductase [Chthoniobacterales bacterium]|nr:Gfo/Idh/MocA family oxidoreductase [Chthoniobacterales bacterium]